MKNIPNILYWLALWRTEGIGPIKFLDIINTPEKQETFSISAKNWKLAEQDIQWAKQTNNCILTLFDHRYPERLKQISAAPPLLFVQGNMDLLSSAQLAIVGSRHPTPIGTDNAYQFAKLLATQGLTITSGLARGIDTASHEGALQTRGQTIAVMGTGPDIVYPKSNQALARKILENGCIVTEFPTGVAPVATHFPRRNRIISGLSIGVLVVEAAYASGSLITAKYALEQNREVFAIPGSIQNPLSRGCHALIKQGATLVETGQDIIDQMHFIKTANHIHQQPSSDNIAEAKSVQNSALHTTHPLLTHIGFDTTPVDVIIGLSGLTAEKVSAILLMLELESHIASVPGGYKRLH